MPTAASGLATAASGMGSAISGAAAKLTQAASAISGSSASVRSDTKAGVAYNGLMNLDQAIATEMKYKPPGSDLVIANSSETIIPAYKGNFPDGEPYKGHRLSDTMEMASGFDRMKDSH